MAITKEELRDFSRFANERLERGEAASLVELAGQWEVERNKMGCPDANSKTLCDSLNDETVRILAAAFPDTLDDAQLQRALERRGGVTTAQLLAKAAAAAEKAPQK